MSHYTVAVFTSDKNQSIDDLLAPYDEHIEVPYVIITKAQLIREERKRLKKEFGRAYKIKWSEEKIYQRAIKGREDELNENGDLVSTYSPNSKWDWYSVGGRWKDMLILKGKGTPCDSAFVSDIDFEAMKAKAALELEPYEKAMITSWYTEEHMRKKYPNKEDYIKRILAFGTYAVVTPDGKWHAPGRMGWWGFSFARPKDERTWELNYYERFIKPAIENNWYITIVDCHI